MIYSIKRFNHTLNTESRRKLMLKDRKLDFTESMEKEWEILKSKIGDGIELPLPDSERWFLARVEGDGIRITDAEKNVRPLKVHDEPLIDFEEFKLVAGIYNETLFGGIDTLSPKLEVQKKAVNMKYIFNLIYNLL